MGFKVNTRYLDERKYSKFEIFSTELQLNSGGIFVMCHSCLYFYVMLSHQYEQRFEQKMWQTFEQKMWQTFTSYEIEAS